MPRFIERIFTRTANPNTNETVPLNTYEGFTGDGRVVLAVRIALGRSQEGRPGIVRFVVHLAHDLAGHVLIRRPAELLPETPEDLPQIVVGVARNIQAAQPHRAAAVFQFAVQLREQGRSVGRWDVFPPEIAAEPPMLIDDRE
jgi:hypothetical protein